jgi:Kef-type K+ transport system membrane component KefB
MVRTIGKLHEPVGRRHEPFGEQFNAETQPRCVRDFLLGLLFVTVGMEVDPSVVTAAPVTVLA